MHRTGFAIDWTSKLRHLLQTLAFCLAVATVLYAFEPEKAYGAPLMYSLMIGTTIWAVIDLGRHLLPSPDDSGWPAGWAGLLLVVGGIAAGFLFGNMAGGALARGLGFLPPGSGNASSDLRDSFLVTLLAGIAGTYWFYSRNKSAWLQRKMAEAQRHASEARLRLLEAQLEPHMLFNTLANLRALIAVDPQRAQQMLDRMIAYLRATLDASRTATHPLQAEFDRLRDYLELMAVRMGPRLEFSLDLPPELAAVPVPALLLQPLVENSIHHGLEPKVEGGRIEVLARRQGGRLLIEVADTGVGAAHGASGGQGFGLAQIRERLAALYGERSTFDLALGADGARARLTLPLA